MTKEIQTLSQALEELLDSKKKSNRRYSLRALARDLDLDQSNLSKIIKGKRKATPTQILKISKTLKLSNEMIITFFETH